MWGAPANRLDFTGVINLGSVGLVVGCSTHYAAYIWSLTEVPSGTIEVRIKNWHFIETVSLFYFFLFAPESISGMANRSMSDKQQDQFLVELRAHSNKTVIAVDSMSVRPTSNFSGNFCSNVTNKGLHVATDLTVEFDYDHFNLYCHVDDDLVQEYYVPTSTTSLEHLEVGETQSVCSNYKAVYKDNNEPLNPLSACDHLYFKKVNYTISYSQDPTPRYDYQGFVNGKDVENNVWVDKVVQLLK